MISPEEKYFIEKGIYEDFQWYSREHGYWVMEKYEDNGRFCYIKLHFHTDKKDAERMCEEYREKYRNEIAPPKPGETVWFMNDGLINVGKVKTAANSGADEIVYTIEGLDVCLLQSQLFKKEGDLWDYLEKNIVRL